MADAVTGGVGDVSAQMILFGGLKEQVTQAYSSLVSIQWVAVISKPANF